MTVGYQKRSEEMAEKKEHVIEMSHRLNLMRSEKFCTNELKVLDKYMSRINPRDKSTRKVVFTLKEFQKDLGINDLRYKTLRTNVEALLGRCVFLPNSETGEFIAFQLFKEVELKKDSTKGWIVTLDCHDRAVDLFFDLAKDGYFSRKLKYSMRLNSANQIKFYMLMKEYEGVGKKKIRLAELIDWLKVNPNMPWKYFKRDVVDICQKALTELTDVTFTYECKRNGHAYEYITFVIKPNHHEQMMLDDYEDDENIQAEVLKTEETVLETYKYSNENIEFLAEACDNSFSEDEMQIIFSIIVKKIPSHKEWLERYDYLLLKYKELKYRISRTDLPPIKSKFNYFRFMLESDVKDE